VREYLIRNRVALSLIGMFIVPPLLLAIVVALRPLEPYIPQGVGSIAVLTPYVIGLVAAGMMPFERFSRWAVLMVLYLSVGWMSYAIGLIAMDCVFWNVCP
jgi:hypothetical protein